MHSSPSDIALRVAPLVFVFLWSTGFVVTKLGLPYAEPMTFLMWRMIFVVAILVAIIAVLRPPWPTGAQAVHSAVTGILMHGFYLGGVFVAISQGVPAGIAALIPGLQPILTSTIAGPFLGEKVTPLQWFGLVLGLVGVLLVLHDRTLLGSGTVLGWIASFVSLFGITLGTLYQKRFGGPIDWRTGNLFQFLPCLVLFVAAAFAFETRHVVWSGVFVFALFWVVVVLSILAVARMYWLIRRIPASRVASLFYLVPATTAVMAWVLFNERLDAVSIAGVVLCAVAVFIVNYRKA
ncbi:MAG: DMT family transporter [Pseudorhodoplanes sp.]